MAAVMYWHENELHIYEGYHEVPAITQGRKDCFYLKKMSTDEPSSSHKLKTRDEKEHELTAPAKYSGPAYLQHGKIPARIPMMIPVFQGNRNKLAFGRGGMEECKQEKAILKLLHINLLV